jgi:hypothetical protein
LKLEKNCPKPSMSSCISAMLEKIPASWDKDSKSVAEICESSGSNSAFCAGCFVALLEFLKTFDTIDTSQKKGETTVKAKSETSTYFIRSLSRYVKKKEKILLFPQTDETDSKTLSNESISPNLITYGPQFVYAMENRRINVLNDDFPIRHENVSVGIIKGRVHGIKEDMYLVHYDGKASRFQWVGGHITAADPSIELAMAREIDQELYPNKFKLGKDYILKKLLQTKGREASLSVGAYSDYRFTVYYVKFLKKHQIKLGANRWVTLKELFDHKTRDDVCISAATIEEMNDCISNGLEGLEPSQEQEQNSDKDSKGFLGKML